MRRPRRRLKKNEVSILETIPPELMVSEILPRVASISLTSIMAVKFCCKKLKEAAEEKIVYQRVSLQELPMVSWKQPVDQNQEIFLNKCRQFGNPEVYYRQAVIDYFNKMDMRSSLENLLKAMELNHVGALYVTCIVFLYSGSEELIQKGIKIVGRMERSARMKRAFRMWRDSLVYLLSQIWVKNTRLKERPVCCTTEHPRQHRQKRIRWGCDEEEEEECEACCADREIGFISSTYNYD